MINIVIPLAGEGKRFQEVGYTVPKPFIDIYGKSMIQRVVESLNIDAIYTFIVRKEHVQEYSRFEIFKRISKNNYDIIVLNKITEGAACTTLLAKEYINNNNELIIANADQIIEWCPTEFLNHARKFDGCILTFKANHPKWSYAKINNELVVEVAEKKVISDMATVGVYYWKYGSDYVKYAEQMINKNIRTNNEFYVCPIYNEAILDNKRIGVFEVKNMYGVGDPESLENYKEYLNE